MEVIAGASCQAQQRPQRDRTDESCLAMGIMLDQSVQRECSSLPHRLERSGSLWVEALAGQTDRLATLFLQLLLSR